MKTINIGIVAHVDAGKTTLTEQILYKTGIIRHIGSVDDGTTATDFLGVEKERGISVKSSCATVTHKDTVINIIDTPGHVDFASEVERTLAVLDLAVLVVSAVEGIQSQTEILIDALKMTNTNIVVFINKIDRVGSNAEKIIRDLNEKFGLNVLTFTDVSDEGEKTCSVRLKNLSDKDFCDETCEKISEFDDEFAENYLMSESLEEAYVKNALQENIKNRNVTPLLLGSSFYGIGIEELLDVLCEYEDSFKNNDDDSLSGIVFKITHDKTMGKTAYVRMFGGKLKNRDSVLFKGSEKEEKITQIRKYSGSKFVDTGEASRGDIVALCGLSNAKISDIIGEISVKTGYKMSTPLLKVKVIPEKKDEIYSVISAFEELSAEDPQLDMEYNQDKKELDISITGKIQLEILSALVKERYNLNVTFSPPTVIYKETPTKSGNGFDAYTMPKPCWAIVSLDIEPGPRGSGLVYSSTLSPDKMWYRYQTHVETAVPRALKQGLYNWEVTDLKVTLVGGEHHTIHTHPMDFFLCTPIAVMKGLQNCGTTLLEPMLECRIIAPEEFSGKIIGDIIAMRGMYDSPLIRDGVFTIEAKIPVSTSLDYSVKLASITSGKGVMSTKFSGYEPCALELGAVAERRGINPLDRDKWILNQRNAIQ